MEETNEFSFRLKPSEHGVGVFSLHPIKKGTYLRLFGDKNKDQALESRTRMLPLERVPEELRDYCIQRPQGLICPPDFGTMPVGWYLNHSDIPNAYRDENYRWYSLRDIEKDEEILIDYNALDEPESSKEEYYSK